MRRILSLFALFSALTFIHAQVPLQWVGLPPVGDCPVSFGVPFPQGECHEDDEFIMRGSREMGRVDFWPTAYWPDGSIKWGAFATVIPDGCQDMTLNRMVRAKGPSPRRRMPEKYHMVRETNQQIVVDTRAVQVYIPRQGNALVDSMVIDGHRIAAAGYLLCSTQDQPYQGEGTASIHFRHYRSLLDSAVVERAGNVRTLVKLCGRYCDGQRRWLPFTVRLYFYRDSRDIRMVHTFTYDGEQDQDFIHSLGLRWEIPMTEQLYNRHVAFATQDGGVWAESIQPLSGRRILDGNPRWEEMQVAGERIPEPDTFDAKGQDLLRHWASWNSFRLAQLTDQGYAIQKRAHSTNPWIGTFTGQQAQGYAFLGSISGGMGIAVQDFWQSYPASLQVDSACCDTAYLTAWLWSPDGPCMNLRHYDNVAHDLNASYEDVQPGMSTPYGIARTTTLHLLPQSSYPGRAAIAAQASTLTDDTQLLPTPRYLHDVQAFGVWSLPDSSNMYRQRVEQTLEQYLDYFLTAQRQHHWYGFWHYGDFMHQYDAARHEWKYDVGGFAWDNTELGSISWLWYSFLRTGRKDIWQAARAMTRHTSEVDVYHIGPMSGLGSRHNVSHWGCGAKEARISQAAWNRFYYYLSTDERTGDLMSDVRDAEQKLYTIDPMRLALPREKYPCTAPARLRIGPDWLAYAGNWLTQWERTGDVRYRDRIVAGMQSISALPHGIFTGPGVLGFDPATGILSWEGDTAMVHTNHLLAIMGGFEIQHEIDQMLPDEAWQRTWLEYCRDYERVTDNHFRISRLKAYAAWRLGDRQLARQAWEDMWRYDDRAQHYPFELRQLTGSNVPAPQQESPLTTTNDCALWSLEAIFMQEVIPQE